MEEGKGNDKIRLDLLLVKRGLAPSREKAKGLIQTGAVTLKGKTLTKPGELMEETAEIDVKLPEEQYVSRGGLKLSGALKAFPISLTGKTCMDAGASTGGFTDCMLQHGAEKVFAVDVGTGQLAQSLREDPRVINLENINIRYMDPVLIEPCDFLSADLSFISLTMVLPALRGCLRDGAQAVMLIKPQFEAGREHLNKHGIVRDRKVHERVLMRVINAALEAGFLPLGLIPSPIFGQDGNREYLLYAKAAREGEPISFPEGFESLIRKAAEPDAGK